MMLRSLTSVMLFGFVALSAYGQSTDHSGFLNVGGDSLYYEISGDGFPLVLVAGGSGMDIGQWASVAPALAKRYRVILVDPRGVGRSSNPTSRYSDAFDLVKLQDHLKLDRVGIIGLSSAGGVVLEYALQYPDRVAGVVAAAPFVPGFAFSEEMLDRLDRFSEAALAGRDEFLDAMFDDPHFIPSPLDPSVRDGARENVGRNYDKDAGVDPSLSILLDPPLIDRLGEIGVPVLLLGGELDHPEVLRRNRFLVTELPSANEVVVNSAGHNLPLENPDGFLEAIADFLDQLERDSGVR